MTDIARKPILGKPVDGKRANDGYRCELCGTWIEYRDLGKVLAHEGPLPYPAKNIVKKCTLENQSRKSMAGPRPRQPSPPRNKCRVVPSEWPH